MANSVTKLAAKHREIMRRIVCGQPKRLICLEMNIKERHYEYLTSSELFKQELEVMHKMLDEKVLDKLAQDKTEDIVRHKLKRASIQAAEVNIELLNSSTERIRQTSAWDILDRTGHTAKQQLEADIMLEVTGQLADNIGRAIEDIKDGKESTPERPTENISPS